VGGGREKRVEGEKKESVRDGKKVQAAIPKRLARLTGRKKSGGGRKLGPGSGQGGQRQKSELPPGRGKEKLN